MTCGRWPAPVPAARYIVEAFAHYPLVAFSEPRHGAGGTKEFLASLIREPGFAGTVQDLVVECGNARYQHVVDRYIAGEPVARDQLKRAWEETTIASGMWLAPMYEAVLADVRAVNLTRPPSQRVRVLLGDPPIYLPLSKTCVSGLHNADVAPVSVNVCSIACVLCSEVDNARSARPCGDCPALVRAQSARRTTDVRWDHTLRPIPSRLPGDPTRCELRADQSDRYLGRAVERHQGIV